MSAPCGNPRDCYEHEGEQCALGELRSSCPYAKGSAEKTEAPVQGTDDESGRVCWNGQTLGLDDLGNLTPRARSITLGVLGDHDAGKTTMLIGAYLALLRGERLAAARFAGSRTLGAWEALASWSRFSDATQRASFPPHTSIGAGRTPGLLHLALRRGDGSSRDTLLIDAPGEWFSRWATDESAAAAEGARWVVEHADVLVVVLDSQRLTGERRGAARGDAQRLIERLGNHRAGRPVLVVWTKADHQPPDGIRRQVQETYRGTCRGELGKDDDRASPGPRGGDLTAIRLGWDAPTARSYPRAHGRGSLLVLSRRLWTLTS
ncbi:MAG: hypothetical protein IPO67_12680 [Deltaproteobacteria bacterium]|nr:hypothetical protein [Deltaproteobacteria bacterium]